MTTRPLLLNIVFEYIGRYDTNPLAASIFGEDDGCNISKSIKLVQVKAELEKYAGDKLTNAELFKFANTLISLADEDFDDGIAREYSQSVNYYSREVDRMIGRTAFTFLCMNSTLGGL